MPTTDEIRAAVRRARTWADLRELNLTYADLAAAELTWDDIGADVREGGGDDA